MMEKRLGAEERGRRLHSLILDGGWTEKTLIEAIREAEDALRRESIESCNCLCHSEHLDERIKRHTNCGECCKAMYDMQEQLLVSPLKVDEMLMAKEDALREEMEEKKKRITDLEEVIDRSATFIVQAVEKAVLEEREACCKAICENCEFGVPVQGLKGIGLKGISPSINYVHLVSQSEEEPEPIVPMCEANTIRRRGEEGK